MEISGWAKRTKGGDKMLSLKVQTPYTKAPKDYAPKSFDDMSDDVPF